MNSEDDVWIYADSSGALALGWKNIGGKWYYFYEYMMVADCSGEIDGKTYAFKENGEMVTGWFKAVGEGCWLYHNSDGARAYGWVKDGGKWYYLNPDEGGVMMTGLRFISAENKYYLFDDNGALLTKWYKASNGQWYYYDTNGEATGWRQIGGKWYYFSEELVGGETDGWMYSDMSMTKDEKTYWFDKSGAMVTGWYKKVYSDGSYDWYYCESSGLMKTGWLKQGSTWYYLDKTDGHMFRKGAYSIDEKTEWFDENGKWTHSSVG